MTWRTGAGARGARVPVEAAPIRLPTDVGRSVGAMPERTRTVSERAKAMLVTTVAALVLATAYSAALGGNGWLWFAWVVLGLATLGLVAAREK